MSSVQYKPLDIRVYFGMEIERIWLEAAATFKHKIKYVTHWYTHLYVIKRMGYLPFYMKWLPMFKEKNVEHSNTNNIFEATIANKSLIDELLGAGNKIRELHIRYELHNKKLKISATKVAPQIQELIDEDIAKTEEVTKEFEKEVAEVREILGDDAGDYKEYGNSEDEETKQSGSLVF